MAGRVTLLRDRTRGSASLPSRYKRALRQDDCRRARLYVSVFGKNLCCAIAENTSHNDQRKSNKQETQPLFAFWKMQDGVGNMNNLEQQPAEPPKDAGFELRDDKSNGTNKIDNYSGDNTN